MKDNKDILWMLDEPEEKNHVDRRKSQVKRVARRDLRDKNQAERKNTVAEPVTREQEKCEAEPVKKTLESVVPDAKEPAKKAPLKKKGKKSVVGIVFLCIGTFIVLLLAAFIVGFLAIQYMLHLIKNKSFKPFAIYTLVLGFLVCLDKFLLHIIF